jgi:hypothetical protein
MTGYVYAIDNGRGCVKIGWAKNPERRLAEINVSDPDRLSLVGYASGSREHEAAIHQILAPHRVRGEWFRIDGSVRLFLELIAAGNRPAPIARRKCAIRRRPFGMTNTRLANALDVNHTTVHRWAKSRVPAERVLEVERITGIPRTVLRPDLYAPHHEPAQ